MKRTTRYQTNDGVLHETPQSAKRHAERRYGEALTKLAAQLVQCEKYTKTAEFIDVNLSAFITLAALKADTTVEDEEEAD